MKPEKILHSTSFSEFFRTASSKEKKKTYKVVLQKATESQAQIIKDAESRVMGPAR